MERKDLLNHTVNNNSSNNKHFDNEILLYLGNVYDLCRICGTIGDRMTPIFTIDVNNILYHNINKHLPIDFSKNGILPLKICHNCMRTIHEWHELWEKCLNIQQYFFNMQNAWFVQNCENFYPSQFEQNRGMDNSILLFYIDLYQKLFAIHHSSLVNQSNAQTDHQVKQFNAISTDGFTPIKNTNSSIISQCNNQHRQSDTLEAKKCVQTVPAIYEGISDDDMDSIRLATVAPNIFSNMPVTNNQDILINNVKSNQNYPNVVVPKPMKFKQICNQRELIDNARIQTYDHTAYKGQACDQNVTTTFALKGNIKTQSDGQKYVCNICNKTLLSKHSLTKHTHNIHNKPKKSICKICYRAFHSKEPLDNNDKTLNVSYKPVVCEICKVEFKEILEISTTFNSNPDDECPVQCSQL